MSSIHQKEFRAAVVKVDITPSTPQMLEGYIPRKSTAVHGRIFHRILILDDGTASFVLISSELCTLSPAFCDRVTGELARMLDVPARNVWWSVTHSHSAPYAGTPGIVGVLLPDKSRFPVDEAYTAMVEKSLIEGVQEARRKLVPAKLGVGWGYAEANINRRARDADGQVVLGMNPYGAVDRRIGLLRLEKASGEPLALIANYAMHATVLGPRSTVVGGDAPGIVSEYVEEKTGVPMLYINGAAGNVAPLYSGAEISQLSQFKVLLGDRILQANRNLRATSDNIVLRTGIITFKTPKNPRLQWTEEMRDYLKTEASGEEMLQIPVRFLRINDDIVIWSTSLEVFCEISNEIRDRSPFPYTFYFGYTNGVFAYMPTEEEYAAGGYETGVSPFTASAGDNLNRAVSRYLQDAAAGERGSAH